MAVARPKRLGPGQEPAQLAEHAYYRMVDAQCADLCEVRRHWPSQTALGVREARDRLARRRRPGGDADQALRAVYAAYGGPAKVPAPVRRRDGRAYLEERLGRPPWPARDLAEDLDEPAIVRKGRRRAPPRGGAVMLRAEVRYRCGAEVSVRYPEGHPEVLERFRRQAARQDCAYCGGQTADGLEAQLHAGGLDVWRRRDVTGRPPRGAA